MTESPVLSICGNGGKNNTAWIWYKVTSLPLSRLRSPAHDRGEGMFYLSMRKFEKHKHLPISQGHDHLLCFHQWQQLWWLSLQQALFVSGGSYHKSVLSDQGGSEPFTEINNSAAIACRIFKLRTLCTSQEMIYCLLCNGCAGIPRRGLLLICIRTLMVGSDLRSRKGENLHEVQLHTVLWSERDLIQQTISTPIHVRTFHS